MVSSPKLKIAEITEILKKEISNINYPSDLQEVGQVVTVEDGIARIFGLDKVEAGEVVEFESDVKGLVINLETDSVSAILIGNDTDVKQGDVVKRTGKILQVPVGKALLGRVVDGMARPIDGKGEIVTDNFRNIEETAPGIIRRKSVNQPLQTGIKVIDALIPIGRGQRELIIGDRQIGKTAIAIDTIIHQRQAHIEGDEKNKIYCVYVAIGQKRSINCSASSKKIRRCWSNEIYNSCSSYCF